MSNEVMVHVDRVNESCDAVWVYAYPDAKIDMVLNEIVALIQSVASLKNDKPIQKSFNCAGHAVILAVFVNNHSTGLAVQIAASHLRDRLPDAKFHYSLAQPLNPALCESVPAVSGFARLRTQEEIWSFLNSFYANANLPGAQPCY